MDKTDLAEQNFNEGLKILENKYGKDSIECAVIINNLARLYSRKDENQKAKELYKRLIDIRINTYGKNSLPVAASMQHYAAVLTKLNEFEEAEKYRKEAEKVESSLTDE